MYQLRLYFLYLHILHLMWTLKVDILVGIRIRISLKFVANGPFNNIAELVKIMAWGRPGDKPLFSAANLALAGIPLTNALGENLPSRH